MCNGKLPTGKSQSFYFPPNHKKSGWFKGMEIIIRKCRLWPTWGLAAQCPNFHCPPNRTDCCCQWLLFFQPDFTNQKSHLQEFIESHGHLVDFYPKYHCELNFIEQYWGAAKAQFWVMGCVVTISEMEGRVA
jgi:hypothetical protein